MEQSSKWSKEQIMALIEAYREEPCLYAVKSQNYHNKNLRAAALQRIVNAVRVVREIATEKECQPKVHNVRSQFNIENAKRKSSLKSGIGTDDAYIPSLWYYEHLMFLEEHFVPRKSKASPIRIISKNPIYQNIQLNSQDFNSQVTCEVNEGLNESSPLYVFVQDKEGDKENISLSTTLLTPSSIPLPQGKASKHRGMHQ